MKNMKMKTIEGERGAFRTGLCEAVVMLWAASMAAAQPTAPAESRAVVASIAQIVRKVEAATVPASDYTAQVHQTVTRPASRAGSSGQPELLAEEDYQVSCSVAGETRATRQVTSRQRPANALTAASSSRVIHGGLLTINPLKALRKVASLPAPELGQETWQNVPCYKLSGRDGAFGFAVWVSQADSSICRVVISQETATLFDAAFTYVRWNNRLAPAHVEITTPSSGTKMIHDYSGHTL